MQLQRNSQLILMQTIIKEVEKLEEENKLKILEAGIYCEKCTKQEIENIK